MEVDELRVSQDTVRAWRHGLRVKNGAGVFAAPPEVQKPIKNSDYMRMFVDSGNIAVLTGGATTSGSPTVTVTSTSGVTYFPGASIRGPGIPADTWIKKIDSATQITLTQNANATLTGQTYYAGEGIGILNAPMSDMAFLSVSGETADSRGEIIAVLRGPRTLGASSTGMMDLWAVLGLLQGGATVESSGKFDFPGVIYFNTTLNKFRGYDNGAWIDLSGGSGGGSMKISSHTHSAATTGAVTYAHGLGAVPTKARVRSNYSGSFSDGSYDGTTQNCFYWGTGAGVSSGSIVFVDHGGGNLSFGQITAMDATNVTITWDKSGTPTGTATIIIEAWE
jgi:hypothetical protein